MKACPRSPQPEAAGGPAVLASRAKPAGARSARLWAHGGKPCGMEPVWEILVRVRASLAAARVRSAVVASYTLCELVSTYQ
jgi:hypothetical protein